jgi:hypothetical protein
MVFGVAQSNSDMAGIFLYASAPLVALSDVLLVACIVRREWARSPVVLTSTVVAFGLGVAFLLASSEVWRFLYSKPWPAG